MYHDVQLLQCNNVAQATTEISHSAVICMNFMIKSFIRRDPSKGRCHLVRCQGSIHYAVDDISHCVLFPSELAH